MKLDYKILWVEDEVEYLESFPMGRIEAHISGRGFEPTVTKRSSSEDVKRVVNKDEFDLLIVDFNITNDEYHGSDLIQAIRDNNCLTEVVFYSASGVDRLRAAAVEANLEGVYFSTKSPDVLVRKITDLFDLTVRKVLDVNNMRGIVMAGVAELDQALLKIINAKHARLSTEDQLKLRKRLVEHSLPNAKQLAELAISFPADEVKKLEASLSRIAEHDPAGLDVLFDRHFESGKRVDTLEGLCKRYDYLKQYKSELIDLRKLLKWRNALAHQIPSLVEDGAMSFKIDKGFEKFDVMQSLSLRVSIKEWITKLDAVLNDIERQSKVVAAAK